jgi:hypothetical protein
MKRYILGIAEGSICNGLALGLSLGGQNDLPCLIPQRSLNGDGTVAEVLILEDPADGYSFQC